MHFFLRKNYQIYILRNKLMKAAYLTEPEKIELKQIETPAVGEDDVLVKITNVGICGSDPALLSAWKTW